MPVTVGTRWAEWEEVADVTVVRFAVPRLLELEEILGVFDPLDQLADGGDGRRLLLNFAGLEAMGSYAVGRLIGLDRRLRSAGGVLALCDLTPVVEEILDIMKLRRRFRIYPTEQAALQAL
jgi:anti-sigma B factor antagonist